MLKKIIWGLVISLWMVIIFWLSGTNGAGSNEQSKQFTRTVVNSEYSVAYHLHLREEPPTEVAINKAVKKWNPIFRKMAHATVYFVLAMLLLFGFQTDRENFWKNATVVLILCFIYSLTDEYHQIFVEGRGGMFTDCLIDTSGSFIACLLYRLGLAIKNHGKGEK